MSQGGQPDDYFIQRKAVELALLRAGVPLDTLKGMSEGDVWIYFFLLQEQEKASGAAEAQMLLARRP